MPNGPDVRMSCARRAAAISALEGTHPVLRQSPPILPFSMRITETPSWAAAAATVRPPDPAPITHRSARNSPPPVVEITPLRVIRATSPKSPPEPARAKPTARSLGCCMAGSPSPEHDRYERDDTEKHKRQHQLRRNEG